MEIVLCRDRTPNWPITKIERFDKSISIFQYKIFQPTLILQKIIMIKGV